MKFVTDINARERSRFIEALHAIQQSAGAMAAALEAENDADLLTPSLIFTMGVMNMQDLFKALATSQTVDMADLDKPFGFTQKEQDEEE